MAAVASIDDWRTRYLGSCKWCTLYAVAHSDDIGKTVDNPHRVLHRLALRYRRRLSVGKAEYVTTKLHHSCRKAKACAGAWLVEQRGELLATTRIAILLSVGNDILCQGYNLGNLLYREVCGVYQMFHLLAYFNFSYLIQLSSDGLLRNLRMRSLSSALI